MSERWIGATVAFVTIVVTLILLALFESNSQPVPERPQSAYDQKLTRLERRGVDAAYSNRMALLYQNWMTDTNEASKDRALRGQRNAQKIYIEIMTAIDARDPEGKDNGK